MRPSTPDTGRPPQVPGEHLAGDTTAPDWQDSIGAPGQPPPAWRVLAASAGFNHSAAVIEVADGAALLEEQGPR